MWNLPSGRWFYFSLDSRSVKYDRRLVYEKICYGCIAMADAV